MSIFGESFSLKVYHENFLVFVQSELHYVATCDLDDSNQTLTSNWMTHRSHFPAYPPGIFGKTKKSCNHLQNISNAAGCIDWCRHSSWIICNVWIAKIVSLLEHLSGFQMVIDARYQFKFSERTYTLEKMFQSAVQAALFELKILANLKVLSECFVRMIIIAGHQLGQHQPFNTTGPQINSRGILQRLVCGPSARECCA